MAFAHKDSDLTDDIGLGQDLSDLVQTYTLATRFDSLDSVSRVLNQVNVGVSSGKILEGAAVGQDENFVKYTGDYSLLSFFTVPGLNASTRFVVKSALQYSDTPLPPVEQFSLGGANRVRAYDIAQFSADSAIYLGVDWIFNLPGLFDFNVTKNIRFARIVQPFVFLDYGYGELNGFNTGSTETGEVSGYGVGLQLNYNNKLSGNLQFAIPLSDDFSQEIIDEPEDDVRVVVDVQYLFN